MTSKMDQGTIIIMDIGRNVATPDEKNEKSFFEKAKECAARIIERKIMSQGKNLVGMILLGSKKTKNNMADQYEGAFRRIQILTDLQVPTWQMIRDLPEQPSEARGDWFDSLLVAADYFQNCVSGFKLASKKIILMTNFKRESTFDPNCVDEVLNGFVKEGFEVDVIGPDLYSTELKTEAVQLARKFVEVTNGVTETFENTMSYLLFHRKKAVKATPWNVDLSIGPNIKIPVSAYIRLKDEPAVKNWQKAIKDPVTSTLSTTEGVLKTREFLNPETQTVVQDSDKIQGYHYGQKIIPFSECDKTMLYQPGEKCLSVYGFTSAKNIQWQHLTGDGLSYVFGRKNDKRAQIAIKCLVECLIDLNLVGIVRRVYNNNNAPKMYVLMPVIDQNNFFCLSMIALCFKEDIKQMSFPKTNFKKYTCTNEQVDAFKELIQAMDLTKAYDDTYDDTEAFPVAECVSPSVQYILDCIAYRAMNPDKPLPKPRQEVMSLFEVPPLLLKKSREPLEKLKKLLTLTKVEVKTRRNKKLPMDIDVFDVTPAVSTSDSSSVPTKIEMPIAETCTKHQTISTMDPISDFKALKNEKPLEELTALMVKALESLIYHNIDGNYGKAIDAMKHLRTEYLSVNPTDYNDWIKKLKSKLVECDKNDVINLIIDRKVSYILKEENSLSTYQEENSHEESQMYENDTVPNSTILPISSEIQNMFDDDE